MKPKLSLELFQIVDAIDRHGSMSAAAEALHKVPSTLSYAVAKLEDLLGFPLFARGGPRLSLTPAGAELLKEGRWLLGAVADLECRLRRIASGYEAELRIVHDSIIPTASFVDDILAFEALKCGTRLRFGAEVMTGAWEALKEGRADLVIAVGDPPSGHGYRWSLVGSLDFVFCVVPGHPLASLGRPVERSDLGEHAAIVVADSARVLPARSIGLVSGQQRITVPNMAAKVALQKAGLGCGFLPLPCVRDDLASGALLAVAVAEPRPPETFRLAWRADASGEALRWWAKRLDRPLDFDALLGGRAVAGGRGGRDAPPA